MIAALTAALEALAAWLQYRALAYLDDREDELIKRLDTATDEIDRLRSRGDPDSQQRADFLRIRSADYARQLEHLRARRAATPGRRPGADG